MGVDQRVPGISTIADPPTTRDPEGDNCGRVFSEGKRHGIVNASRGVLRFTILRFAFAIFTHTSIYINHITRYHGCYHDKSQGFLEAPSPLFKSPCSSWTSTKSCGSFGSWHRTDRTGTCCQKFGEIQSWTAKSNGANGVSMKSSMVFLVFPIAVTGVSPCELKSCRRRATSKILSAKQMLINAELYDDVRPLDVYCIITV